VIRSIESLFRAFLWSGSEMRKSGAKVAWESCSPKSEGGLGFKSLSVWNQAAIAKHIWFLLSGGEQSMWCLWIKLYILKVSLWFDNWHPLGSIWDKYGARIVYDSALSLDAKGKINVDWPSLPWHDLVQLIANSVRGKSLGTIITKLAFTCTVYQLWIARNNRVFSKDVVPEVVVIRSIVDMVRFRVMHITNLTSHYTDSWRKEDQNEKSRVSVFLCFNLFLCFCVYISKYLLLFANPCDGHIMSSRASPLCASNTRVTSVGCATTENKAAASTDSPRSKSNSPSAPNISHSRMATQATSLMDFLLRASATTLAFPGAGWRRSDSRPTPLMASRSLVTVATLVAVNSPDASRAALGIGKVDCQTTGTTEGYNPSPLPSPCPSWPLLEPH
ncbi:hypothetical protein LOK49_LG10G01365, partial [Camellia lanceoleosa]